MNKQLIKEFEQKGLTDGTIANYMRNLKQLHGDSHFDNLDFLKNVKNIEDKIDTKKPSTKRNYYICLCSVLKGRDGYKEPYEHYFKLLTSLNEELKHNTTKSEKQTENWEDWSAIEKKQAELEQKVASYKLERAKTIPAVQYTDLFDYLLLSLYVLTPPRRLKDYQLMQIGRGDNTDFNYCDIKTKKFIFNNYKTSKTYQTVTLDIPEPLVRVIKLAMKFNKSKDPMWLLADYDGNPLDKVNSITRCLNKIFGKSVSVNMLRNIYLTSKYGHSESQLEQDTKSMGTSVGTALSNYIKR